MKLICVTSENAAAVAALVADFRVELRTYKGIASVPDLAAGKAELDEYIGAGFPVFAAVEDEVYAGYLVCRVEGGVVWVESIYVAPAYRRRAVASMLHAKAEQIAAGYGESTVYNYVHPNNHSMIAFLRKHGYTVLNLIEIRKPHPGEKLGQIIRVGEHEFDY